MEEWYWGKTAIIVSGNFSYLPSGLQIMENILDDFKFYATAA